MGSTTILQLTPPSNLLPKMQADSHRVQFYRDSEFLVRSVAQHLAASLSRGGIGLVLATREHRAQILEALAKAEVPAEALLHHYISADANECLQKFMVGDMPDPSRFHQVVNELLQSAQSRCTSENVPVTAFGEMVAILWAEGKRDAAVQLEQLWNEFIRRHPLSLLCAYPLAHFSRTEDRDLFSQICGKHSSVTPAEGLEVLIADDGQARGFANLQQRAQSLEAEVEARRAAEANLRAVQIELESLVEQRTSALRKLSLQVLKLQDLERRRIARELHDSLGQEFVGLKVNLDLARRAPDDPEAWKRCDLLLERCIEEVRTLSYLLHPPMIEDAGFVSAAEWYINDFSRRSGVKIRFSRVADFGRLRDDLRLVLFRVLQESLMNIYRHARCTQGEVSLRRSGEAIVLEVSDNGRGIPRDKLTRFNRDGTGMGVGLTGMRERIRDLGGKFELTSGTNGTVVRITVPSGKSQQDVAAP